jgi:hypothetical protein
MHPSYSSAEFAPLSKASLKRLMKGHTVRVKHGTGLKLALSKMQMKKHLASKKKGQGGYNMTMDPYQSQMHGEGFFDDVGSAFKKMGDSFVQNVAKPIGNEIVSVGKEAGREIVKEGKRRGRKVASQLIHEGIPYASEALGGLAGTTLGGFTGNPLGAEAGEVIGQRLGSYGGRKLADYVGQQTGYGMKPLPKMKPRILAGGTLLIDQPFTARQAVNSTGNFFKDPKGTIGFGSMPTIPNQYKGRPHTGGTLLIDQPFTARQAVNATGDFFKDPKGTIGFGMKKGKRGGALLQAGYGMHLP